MPPIACPAPLLYTHNPYGAGPLLVARPAEYRSCTTSRRSWAEEVDEAIFSARGAGPLPSDCPGQPKDAAEELAGSESPASWASYAESDRGSGSEVPTNTSFGSAASSLEYGMHPTPLEREIWANSTTLRHQQQARIGQSQSTAEAANGSRAKRNRPRRRGGRRYNRQPATVDGVEVEGTQAASAAMSSETVTPPQPAPVPAPSAPLDAASRLYRSAMADLVMRGRWDFVFDAVMGRRCEVVTTDGTRYEGVLHSKCPGPDFSIKLAQVRLMRSAVHGPENLTFPRTTVRLSSCDIVHVSTCLDEIDPSAFTGAGPAQPQQGAVSNQ